ncbi:MAG: lysozyme inhibitor LprI family protein [Methylococcales bacterium]|nr:lysozyme inhibitor LprI family protein [Methylococcales bacterium]
MKKLVLGLVLSALPVASFSASAEFLKCINAEDHSSADGCASAENERQTARMNEAYKLALKSKGADMKALKSAQSKWTKRLQKSCPETSATGGAFEEWQQCLAEKTEIRAIELEK